MTKNLNRTILALFIVASVFFLTYPEVDIAVSSQFYRAGEGFYLNSNWFVQFIYHGVEWLTGILALLFIGHIVATSVTKRPLFGISRRVTVYLLVVMLLGPGFLVTTILKDNWGRARPAHIELFGGTKQFTPPLIPANECGINCSFVSGHAAMGFSLIALAFPVVDRRRKWMLFGGGVAFGSVVGAVRIVQGRHFLSDTIFAFFAVYLVAWAVYRFWYTRRQTQQ